MKNELNYSIEERDNVKIIHLKGVLSIITAEAFELLIESNTYKNNVILDLQDVSMVSSSGINALLNVCIAAKGVDKRVLLYKVKPEFVKMIEAMNIYEQFHIVDSIEEGILKLKFYT